MATENNGPQLKYAIFCHDTEDDPNGELVLKGVIDLIDLAPPKDDTEGTQGLLNSTSSWRFASPEPRRDPTISWWRSKRRERRWTFRRLS